MLSPDKRHPYCLLPKYFADHIVSLQKQSINYIEFLAPTLSSRPSSPYQRSGPVYMRVCQGGSAILHAVASNRKESPPIATDCLDRSDTVAVFPASSALWLLWLRSLFPNRSLFPPSTPNFQQPFQPSPSSGRADRHDGFVHAEPGGEHGTSTSRHGQASD